MPETTENRDRFQRVILPRVKRAVESIALIGNGATRTYETSPDEITALLDEIEEALATVRARYAKALGEPETLGEITPPPVEPATPAKRPAVWRDPPHIQQIAEFVAALPSEHLSAYITHLVNRLCEQAEQTKSVV